MRTRTRVAWFDEICLATIPLVVLIAMSFFTNINLGLRYVLSIFPYVFIAMGKVVPWMQGILRRSKSGRAVVRRDLRSHDDRRHGTNLAALPGLLQLGLGRARSQTGPPHRQQSRLGSGPGRASRMVPRDISASEPIGLAYFGQINPSIFTLRGDPFPWFLPPVAR